MLGQRWRLRQLSVDLIDDSFGAPVSRCFGESLVRVCATELFLNLADDGLMALLNGEFLWGKLRYG